MIFTKRLTIEVFNWWSKSLLANPDFSTTVLGLVTNFVSSTWFCCGMYPALTKLTAKTKITTKVFIGGQVRKQWWAFYNVCTRVGIPVLTSRRKPVILANFQWPKTGFFEAKKPVIFISKIPQFELIFAIFSEKNHFAKIKHFFLKLILVKIWLVEAFTSNKTIRFTSILNVGK